MSKTFAVIQNGEVANIIALHDETDWHGDEPLVEITGTIDNEHVAIGWRYENGAFVVPQKPDAADAFQVQANTQMWSDVAQEQAIAAYLVKIGLIKENPTTIGITQV